MFKLLNCLDGKLTTEFSLFLHQSPPDIIKRQRTPQVDENNKITRKRKECSNDKCGAGIFMASHSDRQHCGKCGLTIVFNKPEED